MAGVNRGPDHDELMSAYLDGELITGELEVVDDLLTGDTDAIADFRAIREVRAQLRLLPDLKVPARLIPESHQGDRLSAYLDGELPNVEMQLVTAHLLICERCRSDLQELDRARIAIRSLPGIEPPEFVAFRRDMAAARSRIRLNRWAVVTASVAAALLLLAGLAQQQETPEPTVTLDQLESSHVARASVQPGFSVFPAVAEGNAP